MVIYGLSPQQVQDLINRDLAPSYAFNLRADISGGWNTRNGWRTRMVLRARDSRYEPARLSLSGRRTVAVSWGCHARVFRYLFEHGATRIKTSIADYKAATFEDQYPATYYHQVGPMMYPASLGDLEEQYEKRPTSTL